MQVNPGADFGSTVGPKSALLQRQAESKGHALGFGVTAPAGWRFIASCKASVPMKTPIFIAITLALVGLNSLSAAIPAPATLHVKDTAGIRRRGYPVNARVPVPAGVLRDASRARVTLEGKEVPAQRMAASRWPDESIQWLDLDFAASLGPLEERTYQVAFNGPGGPVVAAKGLAVSETIDAIQAGKVRFGKTGMPLIVSVKSQEELVGPGRQGFFVSDRAGKEYELKNADASGVTIVKPGPLYVTLRYTGEIAIDGNYRAPFVLTAEMPAGKAWIKASATVDDPQKRLREIAFDSSAALGKLPLLWDFGVGSWSYGAMRGAGDSVSLVQTAGNATPRWEVRAGKQEQQETIEVSAGDRPGIAEGWGHLQGPDESIAFGFDAFGRKPGQSTIALESSGRMTFRFAPAEPTNRHHLTVFFHYLPNPLQISGATSPPSMLQPLAAVCDREDYTRAGLRAPEP